MSMLSIVIPTYNESKSIGLLVDRINKSVQHAEIIVVDDNSPDHTAQIASTIPSKLPVRVILRKDERGLASAVVRGLSEASGEYVCVMDADLSHPPEIIPKMLNQVTQAGNEIAIGSRYANGGTVENWPAYRKWVSVGATLLSRPLTGAKDPMSGFFLLSNRKEYWQGLNPIGYKILLEILVRNRIQKIAEIPYCFENRKVGKSNLGVRQYVEYLIQLKSLYGDRLSGVDKHASV